MNSESGNLNDPKEDISQDGEYVNSGERKQSDKGPKWIDNKGNEVEKVFGFNENAELVNSRAAMFGFFMLILTELVFKGEAATKSIFGIG